MRNLKKKLERKSGVPVSEQRLEKEGKTIFEDDETLKEQGINAGDVLDLKAGMALNIHTPDGKLEVLDFLKPSDTIQHIKVSSMERRWFDSTRMRDNHWLLICVFVGTYPGTNRTKDQDARERSAHLLQ